MTTHHEAAAGIVLASRNFADDETLISAVDVHVKRLNRDELERVVDMLAVVLQGLLADRPVDQVQMLVDVLRSA